MKKFLIVLTAAVLFLGSAARSDAQNTYGVIAGMTFSHAGNDDLNRGPMTNYHVGLVYRLSLPRGFSFEPALIYHRKGAKLDEGRMDVKMGYVEVPLSIQWGPDLMVFRPFLDVTPFVGVAVNNKLTASGLGSINNEWKGLNRFEGGLGVGVGLDIWKMQVIGRYIWNFGSVAGDSVSSGAYGTLVNTALSDRNFRGFMFSATFLFGSH